MNEITCLLLICAVVFLGGIVINILVDRLKASKTAEPTYLFYLYIKKTKNIIL